MQEQIISSIQRDLETWEAQDVLAWGLQEFGPEISIASSFGAEDMVLLDLAAQVGRGISVFTLDTAFLFPETYQLIEAAEAKYGIVVERLQPALTPEEQAGLYGDALWRREPDKCCSIRKVEPLRQKLSTLRAWVTGVRRDQSPTRANTAKVEWDPKFGLFKINPLADWTSQQVWDYIRLREVPYNPLHEENYPSIGCTHCTRAVRPGEDERAGRWSGFAKTECGLHLK